MAALWVARATTFTLAFALAVVSLDAKSFRKERSLAVRPLVLPEAVIAAAASRRVEGLKLFSVKTPSLGKLQRDIELAQDKLNQLTDEARAIEQSKGNNYAVRGVDRELAGIGPSTLDNSASPTLGSANDNEHADKEVKKKLKQKQEQLDDEYVREAESTPGSEQDPDVERTQEVARKKELKAMKEQIDEDHAEKISDINRKVDRAPARAVQSQVSQTLKRVNNRVLYAAQLLGIKQQC